MDITSTYETVIIFTDTLTEEEYNNIIDFFKEVIKQLPATKIKSEKVGKKKLAYEMSHHEYGYYAIYTYQATYDAVEKLGRRLKDDELVLKYMTIKIDKKYTPDDDQSEQLDPRKKPIVDVFDLIFGIDN